MTHVAVVGAYGSAGVAAAERLAAAPEVDRLTLVDDGDPGGGLCILRGCMPSKEVLSAAAHRFQARHDERLGAPPPVALDRVVARKNDHTSDFAAHRRAAVEDIADGAGVTFHHETAAFTGDGLRVGERALDPDYVVLATGSRVNVPDLPGLSEVEYATSADVLDATSFPDTGVVMGFGYVGVELVPYLAEVGGVDLTVIEHDERPLDRADDRFGDALLDLYREEFGVTVLTETRETRAEATDDGVRLHVDREGRPETVAADRLFLFTGRRPAVDGLHLDARGLSPDDGWVTDTTRARDDPTVFVPGDASGDRMLLHHAKEEGSVAAENVCRSVRGEDLAAYDPIHHAVMFAGAGVYPYARVGTTAAEAREEGHAPVVVSRAAADDGVFKTKDAARGLAKLVVARDGTVLGYHGLHHHADVMAKTMQVVVEAGQDVRTIPDRAYHPTTPEILDGLVRTAADRVDGG